MSDAIFVTLGDENRIFTVNTTVSMILTRNNQMDRITTPTGTLSMDPFSNQANYNINTLYSSTSNNDSVSDCLTFN